MYVKRNYGFWMTLNWSKWPLLLGILYALIPTTLYYFFNINLAIPWQPVSVLGIAVAFYLGFKNNSSYDRTWEARKIYGALVNDSRTFGAAVVSFVQGDNADTIKKELIYRHVAWLTTLRFQLRLGREWEHTDMRLRDKYSYQVCEEYFDRLKPELKNFLSDEEVNQVMSKTNVATQLMKNQSARLQELKNQGYFEDFRHMEFHHLIAGFYTDQGKAERIKNFPFPRQYASTALWLTVVFAVSIPFGMLSIFQGFESWLLWMCPVISGLITWVFFLMEKIGDYSENPFEGTYNDVPITNISRGIEIDLREMINDSNIPSPTQPENGFLL